MLIIIGILLLIIGSILRAFATINSRREPFETPRFFSNEYNLVFVFVLSILFGIAGFILIWIEINLFIAILSILAYWFFSFLWISVIRSMGM